VELGQYCCNAAKAFSEGNPNMGEVRDGIQTEMWYSRLHLGIKIMVLFFRDTGRLLAYIEQCEIPLKSKHC